MWTVIAAHLKFWSSVFFQILTNFEFLCITLKTLEILFYIYYRNSDILKISNIYIYI